MEISKRTLDILRNFSTINQSLFYSPEEHGNELVTKSINSNIIAAAKIEEKFPLEFAIFNLNEFLSAISMFDRPSLEFSEKFVTVRETGSKRGGLKYYFAARDLIVRPKKKPVAPEATFSFDITQDQLVKLDRAAKVLGKNDLVLHGDDEGVHIIITDKKDPTSNDFEITVSETSVGSFKHYFKQENWKFIPSNYHVGISIRESEKGISGIGFFTSEDGNLRYGVSVERV